MSMYRMLAAAAGLCFALPALAQLSVTDAWIRGTVAGQMATGAFMKITSARDAKLVEARSPAAGVIEIHEMAMAGNVMRMRAVEAVNLPAGRSVELKPGGQHVMLMDLGRQLKEGDTVPLTLVVETAGKRESVELKVPVRAPTARGEAPHKH